MCFQTKIYYQVSYRASEKQSFGKSCFGKTSFEKTDFCFRKEFYKKYSSNLFGFDP